ncbi:MAG: RIO1 family regulatory kinase/ATPase [Muribaculaceae bacterium]
MSLNSCKIVISPRYEALSTYVHSIPTLPAESLGEEIYHIRNTVYRTTVEQHDIVIKQYRVPHIINRIAYVHLRKSKAERAYTYALRLLEIGIRTPEPIAYICEYHCGMLRRSYFISQAVDATDADRLLAAGGDDRQHAITAMASILVALRKHGILNPDLNPRNVMLDSDYQPYLIDINRLQFGADSCSDGKFAEHFKRIADDLPTTLDIARRYAEMEHLDAEKVTATAREQWLNDHKG